MNAKGDKSAADGAVLSWPRKVLSADDLRRHLTSQREIALLPRAIITPLAADELRARGIRIRWEEAKPQSSTPGGRLGYAQEKPDAAVEAAIRALERDGIDLVAFEIAAAVPVAWARAVAELVARTDGLGGIAFCGDPALACCIANKLAGVRAAAVTSPAHAERARRTIAANLLAIESPGRTFFEVRQIVRAIVGGQASCAKASYAKASCPAELSRALQELDGHAHR